ncbi:DUF1330 domain-containing protein [Desulfopila aestuarii]|uniref:Uncharacterized conserved protein, DUF1330 family n=1 Tax=Desulfopila aestuarii DSM 18488 TaxID=1121416 RepID=A0A1M7YLA4_9BACT|nr:DUF1330 domain-containing protein [Desulfopila aestuarii]SHO53401.1 Uncharacterized conserved protein, DUF1330 family [Desulfopila aestuarii DSM 18488]
MKYYAVAEVNVTSPHWVGPYLAHVNQIVERYGGKYLARTSNIDQVEGTDSVPQTAVILEFPSREAAYGFYNSPEYTPLREAGKEGSFGKFYFVAGEDGARS